MLKISFAVFSAVLCLLFSSNCYAETDWQKALAKGYHELAVGNTQNAIAIFSGKVKGHPNSAACHTALGRAYKRMGRMDEAKTEFRQATQLDDNYADAFYELGVIEEFDNHWSQATSAFERYLTLRPDAGDRRALEDRIVFCKGHINSKDN